MLGSPQKRIKELVHLLQRFDYEYYMKDAPSVSDFEYDTLLKELETLEKKYPNFASKNSPTQRVSGKPNKQLQTERHLFPMLSLSNSYSEKDLADFMKRVKKSSPPSEDISYISELKIDGVAISLVYQDGELKRALTRGDGQFGDNVTENVRTIQSIPLFIPEKDQIEVRGEIFFTHEQFSRINSLREKNDEELFANPRNAASGTLKMQNPSVVSERKLSAFFYTVLSNTLSHKTQLESLKWLEHHYFPVNKNYTLCNSQQELINFCSKWKEERNALPYDIDGLVIKVNSKKLHSILGETSKSPRWAIAYKLPPPQVTTVIKNIVWQVGRTGIVTPVANLKTVFLAGTNVKRATLHNLKQIEEKDIRINDTVVIEKGGDIIPKVVSVLLKKRPKNTQKVDFPNRCPICKMFLEYEKSKTSHLIRCINPSCQAQVLKQIIHFSSKDAMDIKGMGEATVKVLFEKKLIQNVAEIYQIKKSDLIDLDHFAEKSADNLLKAIKTSRKQPFQRLIFALGIPMVGVNIAKQLAAFFGSMERLMQAKIEDFKELKGVGDNQIAKNIVVFFQSEKNKDIIEELRKEGLIFDHVQDQENKANPNFQGKTFVLTGTLSGIGRVEAKAKIEKMGGKVTNTVTKKTSVLIAGEKSGSKLKKAITLGIDIWSEKIFWEKSSNSK